MDIVTNPNPILRKKALPVKNIGEEEQKLFLHMAKVMYEKNGIGLAANQIGIDKQMLVADVGGGLVKLANPVILKKSGRDVMEEGCLSVPDISVKVKRAKKITIEALDENGNRVKINADGLFAKVLQHEIDHLCGILIMDHLGWYKKLFLKNKLHKSSLSYKKI